MELKIEIDETKFKDIIEKELNAFSQEELHGLLKQMILEYMKSHSDTVMNLFINRKTTGYYGCDEWVAGPLLEKTADALNIEEDLKPVKDAIIKDIMDNHRDIVEKAIWRNITNNIFGDSDFKNSISAAVAQHMCEHPNGDRQCL